MDTEKENTKVKKTDDKNFFIVIKKKNITFYSTSSIKLYSAVDF